MAIGPGLLFLFLAATPSLSGIEGQLRALIAADARVGGIAYRLALANGPLCPRNGPIGGLTLQDIGQYAGAVRVAARRLLPTDDVTVSAVVPEGPAARAGILPGDAIGRIDGRAPALPPVTARASYARTGAVAAALTQALRHGPTALAIRRAGAEREVRLVPEQGCALRIQLEPDSESDAGSDGELITLTTALYAAIRSDDELAFVLAHELGHNVLDARAGSGEGRGMAASRERERQADALGVWLMARAGYDPAAAAPFIARMLGRRALSGLAGSHPPSAERSRDLMAQAAIVARTVQAGLPLVPPGTPAAP